jgi:hypothetical protein
MTDFLHGQRRVFAQAAMENWLLAIATALLAFLLLGVLPHINS